MSSRVDEIGTLSKKMPLQRNPTMIQNIKAVTKGTPVHVNLTWAIHDFKFRIKEQSYNQTISFVAENSPQKLNWLLGIQLISADKIRIPLTLNRPAAQPKTVVAICNVFILDSNGEKKISQTYTLEYTNHVRVFNTEFHIPNMNEELQNEDSKIFPDGRLIIGCQIDYLDDITDVIELVDANVKTETQESALNLEDFFTSGDFSDVIIKVGEKKFMAHKIVLASKSPVFWVSHHPQMEDDTIMIEDEVDPDAFREMLRYIYTDKVENLEEYATVLVDLAEKYALDGLRTKCRKHLA